MRHLDTAIVLALVRCRADFTTRNQSDQYTKILGSTYSNFKWDAPLAWEGKKPLTVMAFNDAFSLILSNASNPHGTTSNMNQQNHYIRVLGPKTLRKSSAMPLSAFFLNEVANRAKGDAVDQANGGGLKDSIKMSQTGAMSIDLTALDSGKNNIYDIDRQARMLSTDYGSGPTSGLGNGGLGSNPLLSNVSSQFSPMTQKLISKYLPSRPDEELNQLRDLSIAAGSSPEQMTSKRFSSAITSSQISRPDLIGIAENSRASTSFVGSGTTAGNNKKRPQTMGASSVGGGLDLPPMPSQGNSRASMAIPNGAGNTSSTSSTPSKTESKSVFKTVSGFFKSF